MRCGIHSGHDMSTYQGYRRAREDMIHARPRHPWFSTPCGPDSPLQNINQRTEEQKKELAAKREVNRRIRRYATRLAREAMTLDIEVHWEWPKTNGQWGSEEMVSIVNQLHEALFDGCAWGSRDWESGVLFRKAWRVLITSSVMAATLRR